MGGTFSAAPLKYQELFVKGCLDAIVGKRASSLDDAKKLAEKSKIRNVGITFETRPDCIGISEINKMLELGVTRVELGVQNIYDDIYDLVDRGHTVMDVVNATEILKDSGIKVCFHMMPGMPGSNPERDIEGFKAIFNEEKFKPDMIKIYPTVVVKGTKLYEWWKDGKYSPLKTEKGERDGATLDEDYESSAGHSYDKN